MRSPNYVELIAKYHPDVQVVMEDGNDYSKIQVLTGTLPSKEALDAERVSFMREAIWKDIQRIRDTRRLGGVKVGNNWFHSDDTSRIQHLGLVMFGQNMPTGIMWKTMTGSFVQMTPALAQNIFTTIATNDTHIFAVAEQHRANMTALETPDDYDYTTGWPLIFGEE